MSAIYYGITLGAEDYTVTASATTTGKDIEVVVNNAANVTERSQLLVHMEKLHSAITKMNYLPF